MLKRMSLCVLSLCLLVAAVPASGEISQRPATDQAPTWVEITWGQVSAWLGLAGPEAPVRSGSPERPRAVTAADEGGGHFEPNG